MFSCLKKGLCPEDKYMRDPFDKYYLANVLKAIQEDDCGAVLRALPYLSTVELLTVNSYFQDCNSVGDFEKFGGNHE